MLKKIKTHLLPDFTGGGNGLKPSFTLGAAVFLLEYFFCIAYTTSFSIMGVQAQKIEDFVFSQFKWVIFQSQLKILCAYLVIGGITGLAAGCILYICSQIRGRAPRPERSAVLVALSSVLASAVFLLHDMLIHPALYNEYFYARGVPGKALQMFITDTVPQGLLTAFRALVLAGMAPMVLVVAFRFARKTAPYLKRIPRAGWAAVLAGALLLFAAGMITQEKNEGPNIVVIAADSFRYDRVSALGGKPGLTPHIDAMLREGTSLDDFHVQLPRTFPSWYTLYSGEYPAQHGIRNMFPRREELDRAKLYLPELLKKHGYTVSAAADYAGDIFSRMKCFDRVDAPKFNFTTMIRQRGLEIHFLLLPWLQNRAGRMLFPEMKEFAQNSDPEFLTGAVKREIGSLAGKKRFFLTVFFSATHFPYASPYPYYRTHSLKGYNGAYKYLKINDPTKSSIISGADKKQVNGLFDGACASVDAAFGEIIAALKSSGVYDNSIIIFTADHGENLYDDGLDLGHGEHFRGEYATHVPMIIKFHKAYAPRVKVSRYNGIVQQVDLAPTLLDVMGISNKIKFAGISFKGVIEGKLKHIPRIAYAETGIWFIDKGDQFFQQQRIRYPDVSVLCRIDAPRFDVVLKNEYSDLINIAKHRTVFDEKYKVIYIPTREGVRYEMYRRGDKSYTNIYEPGNPEFRRLSGYLDSLVLRYEKVHIINDLYIP